MIFVPRICEERAGTPLQLLSKLTGTRLLILGGLLVLVAALIQASQRLRAQAPTVAAPFSAEEAYVPVLPPNLARDPFLRATPIPPAIVASRPNVRGEAVMALLAVGAYLAVFAMSAFGGEQAPDLLSIRANGGSNPAPAFAADVLSAQSTVAPAVIETVTPPAAPVVDPAPPSRPEPGPEATPAPPNQHVLRSGETLISVAALYGTTAYDLATANGLTGDLIYAGQVLKIPAR